MSNIYFTADHHFFHNNIIEICNRPFKNINEMYKALIDNHNSIVNKNDITYFIGDFAMIRKHQLAKLEPILKRMNGRKVLILGNHDEGKPFTYINFGFESVHTSLIFSDNIILNHDPAVATIDKNKTWLVGHIHDLFVTCGNCINVGVDVWDFKPVSLEKIMELI